ncbi:hypothetical protein N7523_010119 [Penicillium sp. IBT 18751x]|nr:hypothetical protein N7523_010119 [Penicillium sp. IBT 18751x]
MFNLNIIDPFGCTSGIYKLLSFAQQADDTVSQEHGASSLRIFDILGNKSPVLSHWTGVNPIAVTCYSHNNHGHPITLQSMIASGCMGIEITLFSAGNELLIGPSPDMLSQEINLRKIYLDPLLRMIREHSTKIKALNSEANGNEDRLQGVVTNDLNQTLVLLMDFDADPERVWSQLLPQLEPLREADFLTYFDGSSVVQGPLTIVATGNVPFHRILERSTFRDVFYDAPLLQLLPLSDQSLPENPDYSARNSYYASADFRAAIGNVGFNGLSEKQLFDLRQQVQTAHMLGLKVRYWGTPKEPRQLRNYIWRILAREGVDIITVDESVHQHHRNLES